MPLVNIPLVKPTYNHHACWYQFRATLVVLPTFTRGITSFPVPFPHRYTEESTSQIFNPPLPLQPTFTAPNAKGQDLFPGNYCPPPHAP